MRRRDILAVLAGAADLSGTALAQHSDRVQPAHRLACLVSGSQQSHGAHVDALREGLRDAGYVEGRDFTLDLRWAARIATLTASTRWRSRPNTASTHKRRSLLF